MKIRDLSPFFQMEKQQNSDKKTPKKGTYIDHNDKEFKKKYIKRHLQDLKTNDPSRPGYLSLFYYGTKKL